MYYRLLKPNLINSILIKNIQSVGCTGFCQGGIFHTGLKAVFSNLNFKGGFDTPIPSASNIGTTFKKVKSLFDSFIIQ